MLKNTQNTQKMTSYKGHTTTIILILILTLTQINFISALDFDNVKDYNPLTKTITITNAFGLGDVIADITLVTPNHYLVMPGKDRIVMIFNVSNYDKDYEDALKEMEILNMKNSLWENEKDYHYEYAIYEDINANEYEEECILNKETGIDECSQILVGSHWELTIVRWEKFTDDTIPKGELTIGLITDVNSGDYYDGIPNLFGERIEEWAEWSDSFYTGLVYWNLDETSGTNSASSMNGTYNGTHSGSPEFQPGKINGGLNFSGSNFVDMGSDLALASIDGTITITAWIHPTTAGSDYQKMIGRYNTGKEFIFAFRNTDNTLALITRDSGSWSHSSDGISLNEWTFVAWSIDAGTATFYINGGANGTDAGNGWTAIEAGNNFSIGLSEGVQGLTGMMDEVGFWNRSLSVSEITALYNDGNGLSFPEASATEVTTTLISPADNLETIETSLVFDSSAIIANGELINATLWVWNPDDSLFGTSTIDRTGVDNSTNLTISSLTLNNSYLWNVEWCGDDTGVVYNCSFATSNRTFDVNAFEIDSERWNNTTLEGALEEFEINITTQSSIIPISANLIYNSTSYGGTITNPSADVYSIKRSITVPVVSTNINKTLYWNLIFSEGTISNTTERNQTIYNMEFNNCTGGTNFLYNFTIVDEKSQNKLIGDEQNTSADLNLQVYNLAGTTLIQSYSNSYNITNSFGVCMNISLSSSNEYKIDLEVQYSAKNYAKELYNIQKATITAETLDKNITLYDLDDSSSTEFEITYKDDSFLPVQDALIQIQRKYISEDLYKAVEIPKTDAQGSVIAHLELNEVLYTFVVTKNGVVLSTFTDKLVYCPNPSLEKCIITLNELGTSISTEDYTQLDDFSMTLNYNRTSRVVTSIFSVPSSTVATVFLNVTLFNNYYNQTVCSDTLTSNSGTLTCTIPVSYGNTSVITEVFKDGTIMGRAWFSLAQDSKDLYGGSLMFLGVLLMLTLVGVGVGNNPIVTGFFLLIGAILSISLNLFSNAGFIGKGATILWLFIAVILIIVKASKRE